MIDASKSSAADDILNAGEALLEKLEKEKGYPALNGMEQAYSQVKVHFDPALEKKLQGIARVVCCNNPNEVSGDLTTNSGSFLPPFSFNEEEEVNNEGLSHVKQTIANDALNLSNISFNEAPSPINQTTANIATKADQEETKTDFSDLNDHQQQHQPKSRIRRMSTSKIGGDKPKKKNDLPSAFRGEAVDGHLDLSNRSK